jgi:hypothetical protein
MRCNPVALEARLKAGNVSSMWVSGTHAQFYIEIVRLTDLTHICAHELPLCAKYHDDQAEQRIAPVEITHDPKVSRYSPYEFIYLQYKQEYDIPLEDEGPPNASVTQVEPQTSDVTGKTSGELSAAKDSGDTEAQPNDDLTRMEEGQGEGTEGAISEVPKYEPVLEETASRGDSVVEGAATNGEDATGGEPRIGDGDAIEDASVPTSLYCSPQGTRFAHSCLPQTSP